MYCLYRIQDFLKTFSPQQPSSASKLGYVSIVSFDIDLENGFLGTFIPYRSMFSVESQKDRKTKDLNRQKNKFKSSKRIRNDCSNIRYSNAHKHNNLVNLGQIGMLRNKDLSFKDLKKHKSSWTGPFFSWIQRV